MMRFYLLFFGLSLMVPLHSQVVETRNGTKCVTSVIPLKNGKFACNVSMTRNSDGLWSGTRSPLSFRFPTEPPPYRAPGASVITHHIVFHMDYPGFTFSCVNADTAFMAFMNLTWTSNGLEGDITEGYYYLFAELTRSTSNRDSMFYVYQKNFHVYKDMDTTILHTSATHLANLVLYDKNGVELHNKHHAGDYFALIMQFPDSCYSPSYGMIYNGFFGPYVKFSDVPPEIRLVMGKSNVSLSRPYTEYTVQYPTLSGLDKDTTLSFDPSAYQNFNFYYHPTPAFDTAYFEWGYGSITNDSLTGYQDSFVGAWITREYPGWGIDTAFLYIAGVPDPSFIQNLAALVGHSEMDPLDHDYPDFFGPIFYLNPEDELVLTCYGNYPSVAGDYMLHDGNRIDFGSTAPFHFTYNYNVPGEYTIDMYQHFRDQTGCRRDIDISQSTYDVWQNNVMLYHDTLRQYHVFYWTPGPGVYSFMVHDSNYTLLGKPGYLETNMTMDLGAADPNPPALIAFKILMCDSIHPELVHGYWGSVEFTAGDFDQLPPEYDRVYHSLAGVYLLYKEYSDTVWKYLPVIEQTSELDSLCGMPYHADLQPVLDQFPDSAWIDLRIDLIDSAGNYNMQTMHPAFLVRDAMVSVQTQNTGQPLYIYPNPAINLLKISTKEEWTDISVFSPSGQQLMQVPFSKELNVTRLNRGIYLLRISDSGSGRVINLKFVKAE